MTFSEVLGAVLRYHRKRHGYDQAHVGHALGISTSAWCRIETGRTVATITHLRAAAGVLGVEAYDLLRQAEQICERVPPGCIVVEAANDTMHAVGSKAVYALVVHALRSTRRPSEAVPRGQRPRRRA